jgi:glutaminyl-peptide cyclotransferase
MKTFYLLLLTASLFIIACSGPETTNPDNEEGPQTPFISYSIVATYPHDTSSFTQGLVFYNGKLYEGTGNYDRSKLLEVDLNTGKAVRELKLNPKQFGEGITVLNDTIYQLTWMEHVVNVYTAKDFKKVKEFTLNTEGWGITHDSTNLIVTDGSSNIYFYDPSTFRLLRVQAVLENGSPVPNLNEVEYINGYVYANQWQYNHLLKIDPKSGIVVGRIDLSNEVNRLKAKMPDMENKGSYLNGIAYNPQNNKMYVTGKNWPEILEIQFQH